MNNSLVDYLPIIVFILLLKCISVNAVIMVHDDSGQLLVLPHAAQRVISLAPHSTEILFAIGAGASLVGVDSASDYPPAVKQIPQVANYVFINTEAILALHPDLIVAYGAGIHNRQLSKLQSLGIPVYFSDPHKILDIAQTMQQLGQLTGKQISADSVAEKFRHQYKMLCSQPHQQRSVFYELGDQPLLTINQHNIIYEALVTCGGQPLFSNLTGIVPRVNFEAVLYANPQVIIADEHIVNWQQAWQRWPQLAAVKNHALLTIPTDLLQRPGPRFIDGVRILCEKLN